MVIEDFGLRIEKINCRPETQFEVLNLQSQILNL